VLGKVYLFLINEWKKSLASFITQSGRKAHMSLITAKITVIISGTNRCNCNSLLQLVCDLKISLHVIVHVKNSRNPLRVTLPLRQWFPKCITSWTFIRRMRVV
jgi:hypothetical protein